jgi:toxin ParE1/3/4
VEKKQLKWSEFSRENVAGIRDYLTIRNPAGAANVLTEIRATAHNLIDFPLIGKTGKRAGTRELVLKKYPYKIVYKITAKSVIVAAVYHQSLKIA